MTASTAAVFLQKTYDLIQSTPSDVAEWSNEGRSFVIKKIKEFETNVLPKYFKHGNFASFSRQLRFYGFDKTKKHDIRITQLSALTNQISALTSVVHSYCQPEADDADASACAKKLKGSSSPISKWTDDDAVTFAASDDEIDSGILDALLEFPAMATPLIAFEL
ncbi:hypothetical protein DYB30_011492 [Aphanomyces astaci]|uniref:HSF-type DNA-binding domain-containing protein n=1 Tax=Aphanomyces astaci TaxID=112090 RepID=A0A397CJK5_APHAT|nr:hypothetical protein DYB34_011611 [Aphanomyces astaci]RHY46542.1 hypothetical protein DYB30_011492 [Aphanomyces astaci]